MDISKLQKTPAFVVDEAALERNLSVLKAVSDLAGCRILLALKGFSMFRVFPLLRRTLAGTCASSLNEARLGGDDFGGETHIYSPAYRDDEIDEILELASHISFNSISQWTRHSAKVAATGGRVSAGLRVNPEHSEVEVALYDPCRPQSRLGITADNLKGFDMSGIDGLHFHCLCELNADALERTLAAVEEKFAPQLRKVKWVNFGGGHHITRADYDVDRLCRLINDFRARWNGVDVYLEPGEAVALNAGVLVSGVLDIISNNADIAILDTSASTHMPDVIEMPYRPEIEGAGKPGERKHDFLLGGVSCLAGDVIGSYSFDRPLKVGDRLVFGDMAHYSMVKTTTFNGVGLPDIVLARKDGTLEIVREFGYADFRSRLS